jgi:hypothetical protein
MAFQTIHVTPGLNDSDRRRAHRSGPWAVASAQDPAELMRRAGFVEIHATDKTDEFRTTARAWIDQWDQHRTALVELHGDTAFETRQKERRIQLQAIEDGLLQRSLVLGIGPHA